MVSRLPVFLSLALAAVSLAGCLGDPLSSDEDGADPVGTPPLDPHVVVAVIDSGINVYHERFQLEGGMDPHLVASFVDAASGAAPVSFPLTRGEDYESSFEADQERWKETNASILYHFEGTNVLGISFDEFPAGPGETDCTDDGSENPLFASGCPSPKYPVLDEGGHGTGTAGATTDANPDVIIVMVERGNDVSGAEAWAAAQPWIDIVSMSYGPFGSIPFSDVFDPNREDPERTSSNTHAMWLAGQLPVGAADNSPSPATQDETAGPPWVVGVAGDHPDQGGCREPSSGSVPDFTADFTQELPVIGSLDERRSMSGTSFATPTTAGVFSRVLLDVRTAWNHTGGMTAGGALAESASGDVLTNEMLRAAVERTAYYFEPAAACAAESVNPAAPWLQQGWGHVGPEIANATSAHILGIDEAPAKEANAVAFMQLQRELREQYWS